MKKDRLVIDVRMINSSGIGSYLKNIIPTIIGNFSTVLLGNEKELSSFDWSKNCQIISFNSKVYSLQEQIKYMSCIPNAELLWCPHFNVPLFPVKAKKIVSTIHDVNHLTEITDNSFLKKKYATILYNNAINKSSKVVTVSNFSRSELLKYTKVNATKVEVVHCAVNNLFSQKSDKKSKDLPENYILFVGNLKPHKNLITLLKAYKSLSDEIKKNYKLVVVGKKKGLITSDKKALDFIKQNNLSSSVYFTGYIVDALVPTIYKNAVLFVFPSHYEGFGLPVLEAMASGTPVISSNAASLKEVGGDSVEYFDPSDENKLKEKIALFLRDKDIRNQYIKKGFDRLKLFSWEKSANRHIEIFEKIINSKN